MRRFNLLTVQRSTTVRVPLDAAFRYFGDFANTSEWDPGVVSSRKLAPGPPKAGDEYSVVARFGGRKLPMRYEVLSVEAPHRIMLRGTSSTSTVRDVIEFERVDGRTKITWTLDVELRGVTKLAEPLMKPLVDKLARRAIEGIERASWDGIPQQSH